MARLSPITIGMSTLAVVVLGTSIYLVVRSLRPMEAAAVRDPWEATPPPIAVAGQPAVAPKHVEEVAPLPVEPPAAAAQQAGAVDDHGGAAADDASGVPEAAAKKRELLIAVHNQKLLQEADDGVFEVLKIPEPTRAAIRRIDDGYNAEVQASPGAERARREAISDLLGAELADKFDAAERAGVHRLRGTYRWERARLLRE